MLTFHPLKVLELKAEASDAICITLEVPPALAAAYVYAPGQHVGVRANIDGREVRRTYSICTAAGAAHLRIGVRLHEHGSMSQHLARHVRVGDCLEVMTPAGRFFAQPEPGAARTYCAFAAGSGITPVFAIVSRLLAQEPASRVLVFYGNRSIASIMFAEELLALKDRYLERLSLYFILSREPQDVALFNGRLDGGKVADLARTLFDARRVDAFFLCGPGTMIDTTRDSLLALGVEPARIHAEHFTSDAAPVPAATPAAPGPGRQPAGQIEVDVVMDGRRRSFTMNGDGTTVLEAAELAGLELPYSCRAGVCSTCRARVVRGAATMKTNYALEPWEVEAGYVLCCQAVPAAAQLELTYDER